MDENEERAVRRPGGPAPETTALYAALAQAQGEFATLHRDRTGQQGNRTYQYATHRQAIEMARPILAKHGLAVLQTIHPAEGEAKAGNLLLATRIVHQGGGAIESWCPIGVDLSDSQKAGKVVSGFARVAYMTALCLAVENEDDQPPQGQGGPAQQRRRGSPQDGNDPLAEKRQRVGKAIAHIAKAENLDQKDVLRMLTQVPGRFDGWRSLPAVKDERDLDRALARANVYRETGSIADPETGEAAS